jgi:hypothetical protein
MDDRHNVNHNKITLSRIQLPVHVSPVGQKTVPMFHHFEQTCTNQTLTPKPALEKNQGDSITSYLQFGVLHA